MAKYRRKDEEIVEAVRWDGTDNHPAVKQLVKKGNLDAAGSAELYDVFIIRTIAGPITISPGDWIVKGTTGEYYPCKPNIFKERYKPVKKNCGFSEEELRKIYEEEND